MKYWIGPLGRGDRTETTKDAFEQLRAAWDGLLILAGVEEKFKIVLDNYVEYERELLEITLRDMLFSGMPWSETANDIYTLNRRLGNLLMASRLYLDQSVHDVKQLRGSHSADFVMFQNAIREQYDTSLAYRVMDSLRNYSQHNGLPIEGLNISCKRVADDDGPAHVKWMIRAVVHPAELVKSKKIKQQVVDEFVALGEEPNITPLVREYVACFARIHATFRKLTASDADAWCALVRKTVQESGGTRFRGAEASVTDVDAGGEQELVRVFCDLIDRFEMLIAKNRRFESTPFHFVSGEA
jgi:hypothetical protein